MSEKKKIKFNKYNSEETFNEAILNEEVDNATFSVVRTVIDDDGDDTNDIKDLYLHKTKLTDRYNSRVVGDDVRTSVTVGGLKAGTSLDELKNMSLGEVIDKMLFKTTFPTIGTNVSASVTYVKTDWLVGTEFDKVTTVSVNNGQYKIESDGSSISAGPVGGGLDHFDVTYTPSNRKTVNGTNKISVKIYVKPGPTPNDSEGNPYTSESPAIPYPGGMIEKTITIKPYYNWYATGKMVGSESQQEIDYTLFFPLTELSPVSGMGVSTKEVMLDISGGTLTTPQTIKVPGTISNCKTYISGTWVDYAFSEWYKENTQEQINGKSYHVYNMKPEAFASGPVGGTRLKFTVTP